MAKKFLYFIAIAIVLIFVALITLRIWSSELTALALVPDTEFIEQEPLAENAYQDPALWYSRPGIGVSDPARWQPAYAEPDTPDEGEEGTGAAAEQRPIALIPEARDFAVFFVHPTSYLDKANWNAP
ncbi:MAG: hypothetical protein AAGL68_12395, partial [Pseudomonadota bacterium]